MGFWKSVYSPKSEQSWGRVAASVALLAGLAWTTRLILLISMPEQFDRLGSVALFIGAVTGLVSTLYGLSKGLDTLKDIKGGGNAQNPPAV